MTDWGDPFAEAGDLGGWGDEEVEEEEEEEEQKPSAAKRQRIVGKVETKRLWHQLPVDVILTHILGSLSLKGRGAAARVSKELQALSLESRERAADVYLDEREFKSSRYQTFIEFVQQTIDSHQQGQLVGRIVLKTGDPNHFLNEDFFAVLLSLFSKTRALQICTYPLNSAAQSKERSPESVSAAITSIFAMLNGLKRLEWINQDRKAEYIPELINKLVASGNRTITDLIFAEVKEVIMVAPLVHWGGASQLELLDLQVSLSVYTDAEEAKLSRQMRAVEGATFEGAWGCAHVGRLIDRCAATLRTLRLSINIPVASVASNVHESMLDLLLGLNQSPKTIRELRIRFTGEQKGQPSLPQSLLRDLAPFSGLRELDIAYPTETPEIPAAEVNTWAGHLGRLFASAEFLEEVKLDLPDVMRAYLATADEEHLHDAPLLFKIQTQPTVALPAPRQVNEQRLLRWTTAHPKLQAPKILDEDIKHVITESKQPRRQFEHVVKWSRLQKEPRSVLVTVACNLGPLSASALPLLDELGMELHVTELGQAYDVQIDAKFLHHLTSKQRQTSLVALSGAIDFDEKDLQHFLDRLPKLTSLAFGTPPPTGSGPARSESGGRILRLIEMLVARDTGGQLSAVAFYSGAVGITAGQLFALKQSSHGWTEFTVVVPGSVATQLPKEDFVTSALNAVWSMVKF